MGKITSADGFVNHTSFDSYGGSYLKTWRKDGLVDPKEPTIHYIDTWMHTQAFPQPRWAHGMYKIENKENKETRRVTKEVWSDDFVCWEEEAVLKKQYRRDDHTGQREEFPNRCAHCRLVEVVYQLVTAGKFVHNGKTIAQGKLSWIEPLFVFEGSDPAKTKIMHAAGLYNGYKNVEAGSDDEKAINEAGIYRMTSWQESMMAKLTYMFAVVDNGEPGKGIQITEESGSLGDKVKQVVAKSRESKMKPGSTDDLGNPWLYPFAIRWKFNNKKGLGFDKKYDALKMEHEIVPLTDEIDKAIRVPVKDWFAGRLRLGDAKALRATLEQHATEAAKLLPWNWIFDGAEEAVAAAPQPAASRPVAQAPVTAPAAAPQPAAAAPAASTGRRRLVKPEPAPPPPVETIPCDECHTPMLPTQAKCPNPDCAAIYDVSDVAPAPAAAAPAPAAKVAPRPAAPPPGEPDPSAEEDIPF